MQRFEKIMEKHHTDKEHWIHEAVKDPIGSMPIDGRSTTRRMDMTFQMAYDMGIETNASVYGLDVCHATRQPPPKVYRRWGHVKNNS